MTPLTDPVSIIATASNLRPGEDVVVYWALPAVAYVFRHSVDPVYLNDVSISPAARWEHFEADQFDLSMVKAASIYDQQHDGNWVKVHGRGVA